MSRLLPYLLSLFSLAAMAVTAQAVEIGDSIQDVRLELGNPDGEIKTDDIHVYLYPRGELEFSQGNVSEVRLVDEETYRNQQRAVEEAVRAQQERRMQLREELDLRAANRAEEILNDPAYTNELPERRIEIWEEYRIEFPDYPLPEGIAEGLEEDQAHVKEEKKKQEAAKAPPIVEEKKPTLSGSKSKKRKRGAGKVKPEDRPSFMTRQTLFSDDP